MFLGGNRRWVSLRYGGSVLSTEPLLWLTNYLDLTRGTAKRKKLVQLRISSHKLMIEVVDTIKLPEIIGIALFEDPIK